MIEIRLPLPKKISTNEIYSGKHWSIRNKHKNLFRSIYVPILIPYQPLNFPAVHYHFFFKKKALDHSNCSYMVKLIEDCMIKAGMIKDDSPKYVDYISIKSHKIEKYKYDEDYVVLMIEENKLKNI